MKTLERAEDRTRISCVTVRHSTVSLLKPACTTRQYKCVLYLTLQHIFSLHFRFVPESQSDISPIYFRQGCAPSNRMGYFTLGAKCTHLTGEKILNNFCTGRGLNQDRLRGSQTLYRVAIKAVQVCIIPNITTWTEMM